MKVFLSPWICNPRVFEVRIYNPPHHFGSQTLMLRNGGLQIQRDGMLFFINGNNTTIDECVAKMAGYIRFE